MIKVVFYKSNSARKKNEVFGTFDVPVKIKEVTPIDTSLKGKKLKADEERFALETEQARLDAQFAAIDEVRAVVGHKGVVVALNPDGEENK